MLPKVLFLRTCKAEKGLFSPNEHHTDLTVTSISPTVIGDSGLNFAPNGKICHILVTGGIHLFSPFN